MSVNTFKILFLSVFFFFVSNFFCQDKDGLNIISKKKVGQIEVGGPFAGIEIHNSFPALNRISFYYPVANSIDISRDYWNRADYRIMSIGVKAGDSSRTVLEEETFQVDQTPYSARFSKDNKKFEVTVKYQFCKSKPALVATYILKNKSKEENEFELYTRLEGILRTSHSYNLIDEAYSSYDSSNGIIRINFENSETGKAQVFIANAGVQPSSFTSKKYSDANYESLNEYWLKSGKALPGEIIPEENPDSAEMAFIYQKILKPEESFQVVQIIGSAKIEEAEAISEYLLPNYEKEIKEYENYILENSVGNKIIKTGNNDFDFTTEWAQAVLAANAHFIDGGVQPMPAQAEYNFYFTHDVLLTDLAAVNFDLPRVKKDLQFILDHSNKEKVIPHAYYWKDSSFKTEYAGTENWNHFWFILVGARYFRHSNDREFLVELYPFMKKSIETALQNLGEDTLMYSFRPDWWDIGNNYGPRSYMTILASRALREFVFAAYSLNKPDAFLKKYYDLADSLNENLTTKLWSDSLKYLISYFEDGTQDKHIYMGSMLAPHFNLLNDNKSKMMMKTAEEFLLDENIGIYTLFPMDLDKLKDFMGFVKGEAGEPFHYANGGIWNHGNAWYALGLIANGNQKDAYRFIDKIMTLRGIIESPNGQPAMYEYRISDKSDSSVYGKIDKPQFLWAGSWYIYTLYNLFGIRENEWNISFEPFIPASLAKVVLKLTYNKRLVSVSISGQGEFIQSIKYDEKSLPSSVIPANLDNLKKIDIVLGDLETPIIKNTNGKLISPEFNSDENYLSFNIRSYKDKILKCKLVSPFSPKRILKNQTEIKYAVQKKNQIYEIDFEDASFEGNEFYKIEF